MRLLKFIGKILAFPVILIVTVIQVYSFVPQQDFSKSWSDAELYEKYSLDQAEIDLIESIIRPMDVSGGLDDAD